MAAARHRSLKGPKNRPAPVFSGKRALAVGILFLVLVTDMTMAVVHARSAILTPHAVPPRNAGVQSPGDIEEAMLACKPVNPAAKSQLDGIPIIGAGVLLRIVEVRRTDQASFAHDPFTGQSFRRLTTLERHATRGCGYAVERYAVPPEKTIALTYDDGPHPTWTPKILQVLEAYDVPATFFVIGQSVVNHKAIFRRIVDDHVVGNHTLSHAVLGDVSSERAREELLLTDRTLAAVGGVETNLFRLPYGGSDVESIRKTVRGLVTAQQLGKTNISFTTDPADFEYTSGDPIPLPTLNGQGEVIVLHDGGGNRAATVDHTIKLIQQGQAKGYRFITVDELARVDGPRYSRKDASWEDSVTHWVVWVRQRFVTELAGRFLWWCTIAVGVVTFGAIGLALYGDRRQRRRLRVQSVAGKSNQWYPPKVSVLIAAFKEEQVIEGTIRNIFQWNYPFDVQLVVVNDGSPDRTGEILDRLAAEFREYPKKLEVIHVPKGGKGKALNTAIRQNILEAPVTFTIDADTYVDAHTILEIVRVFEEPRVGAAAGRLKVANFGRNPWQWLLATWQQADYNLGIGITRMAQAAVGAILIVPGACSAWRTRVLTSALDGFPLDTVAEDADAGLLIRWRHWKVVQVLDAVAYTQVPTSWRALRSQQLRWTFGIYQVLYKHSRMIAHPLTYGPLAWFVMPYAFLSTLIPTLVLPVSWLLSAFAVATGNWRIVVLLLVVFTGLRVVMSVAAMVILREWSWDPLTALFYRPLNDPLQVYLAYRSLYSVLTGHPVKWAKVPRVGHGGPGGMVGPTPAAKPERLAVDPVPEPDPALM